jgi:CheY-like chemotaxis protein
VELEARLIDDMLDLTRIARGKLTLNRRIVDGREVLRHAIETCHAEAMEKELALEASFSPEPLYVDGDPARLQQVFWNLLKNAIKFTPDHGRITVTATATELGGLRVQVSDSGKGIERETLPRVFDAFEQGGSSVTKRYGGLGLGLAICKGLVGMHEGAIRASSDGPGKGSTFVVELPPAAGRDGEAAGQGCAAVGAPAGVSERGYRILLVEDHESTAVMTARLLRSFGHQVTVADCVKCALERFAKEPVDLVISDLGLPDGSGHDLLRQLLAQRPVPAIALSGYGMDGDIQESTQAGFQEHLVKPINARQLGDSIDRVLGRTRRDLAAPEEQ